MMEGLQISKNAVFLKANFLNFHGVLYEKYYSTECHFTSRLTFHPEVSRFCRNINGKNRVFVPLRI